MLFLTVDHLLYQQLQHYGQPLPATVTGLVGSALSLPSTFPPLGQDLAALQSLGVCKVGHSEALQNMVYYSMYWSSLFLASSLVSVATLVGTVPHWG